MANRCPASIKILMWYEVITGHLEPLQVLAGKRSDQSLAGEVAARLRTGQLEICDKGFL